MESLLDLGTAGSVASVVSLVLGFVSGAWWRRIRTLIARDRESTMSLLGPVEIYRYLQRAEEALGAMLVAAPGGRRVNLTRQQQEEVLEARDGVLKSLQALNTFIEITHRFNIAGRNPLMGAARFHRSHGPLASAVRYFELALQHSDDGKMLSDEDRRACIQGLQYCAVVRGEREEARRWAREAAVRKVDGCISERQLLKWFIVYRYMSLLRLIGPSGLRRRWSGRDRSGLSR